MTGLVYDIQWYFSGNKNTLLNNYLSIVITIQSLQTDSNTIEQYRTTCKLLNTELWDNSSIVPFALQVKSNLLVT